MTDDFGQAPGQPNHVNNGNESAGVTTTAARRAEAQADRNAKRWLYEQMATDIAARGKLRKYVPDWPSWHRRIGTDVFHSLVYHGMPDPSEVTMLLETHARAIAARDEEQQARRQIDPWYPRRRRRKGVGMN